MTSRRTFLQGLLAAPIVAALPWAAVKQTAALGYQPISPRTAAEAVKRMLEVGQA